MSCPRSVRVASGRGADARRFGRLGWRVQPLAVGACAAPATGRVMDGMRASAAACAGSRCGAAVEATPGGAPGSRGGAGEAGQTRQGRRGRAGEGQGGRGRAGEGQGGRGRAGEAGGKLRAGMQRPAVSLPYSCLRGGPFVSSGLLLLLQDAIPIATSCRVRYAAGRAGPGQPVDVWPIGTKACKDTFPAGVAQRTPAAAIGVVERAYAAIRAAPGQLPNASMQ